MSRSKVKRPYLKCSNRISNKAARQQSNQNFRRIVREILRKGEEIFPAIREVSDVWAFPSDGLALYCGADTTNLVKYLRK